MSLLKNLVTNPFFMGILSAVIAVVAFLINYKIRNEKINNNELMKVSLLGFFLGMINTLIVIYISSGGPVPIENEDFFTGNPDF